MISFEVGYYFNKITSYTVSEYLSFKGRYVDTELKTFSGLKKDVKNKKYRQGTSGFIVHFWEVHDSFDFSEYHLDLAAQSITFLGHFSSWVDFLEKVTDNYPCRVLPTSSPTDTPVELIKNKEMAKIDASVYWVISIMFNQSRMSGLLYGREYKNIIELKDKMYARSAELDEIDIIDQMLENHAPEKRILNKEMIFRKFPNSFIVILNFSDAIVGHLAILPVDNHTLFSLMSNEIDEGNIGTKNLSIESSCYYIGQAICLEGRTNSILRRVLKDILSKKIYLKKESQDVTTYFFAHSSQQTKFLKKLDFVHTPLPYTANSYCWTKSMLGILNLNER